MKLTPQTLRILKNFATINSNLVITAGSTIQTITTAKTIMAEAVVTEAFDVPFGIYDLAQFIATIEMLDDPDLSFGTSAVTLSSGKVKSVYRYAAMGGLTKPEKKITMPAIAFTVDIPADAIDQIRKAAGVFGHSIAAIEGEDGTINLTTLDPKNGGANTFSITLAEEHPYTGKFSAQFLIANLKLIPGAYSVEVSTKCISHWVSPTVQYFIALEQSSIFPKA
jgi:hypothetical protein